MGVFLWAITTSSLVAAAYVVVCRLAPTRGMLERALAVLMTSAGLAAGCLYLLGLDHGLRRLPVLLCAWALAVTLLALGLGWRRGRREVGQAMARDVRIPGALLRDAIKTNELASYALVLALLALSVSSFIAWRFPSWSWDVVWYHLTTTNYAVQTASNGWIGTNIYYVDGYPRLTELLSVWNDLLVGTSKLDDLPQVPFAVLGGLAVTAFCRRTKASPSLSASLGAMWIATPAVCLQIHTTHADIAAGALFLTACYFLTAEPFDGFARGMTFLAFGLYAGTKVTGLFHLVLVSPVLLWRLGRALTPPSTRGRVAVQTLAHVVLLLAAGGFSYVRNLARSGNPFWPVRLTLPLVHATLPGPIDPHDMAWPPAFFGAPGAFGNMLRVWYTPSGNYYPDVRDGPFGILFAYLALPAFCILVLSLPFGDKRGQRLAVVGMGVLAVLVPVAWWGRYVLAAAGAALVAVAYLHDFLRTRALQVVLSAAAAFLSVASYAQAVPGYRALPTPFASAEEEAKDDARLRSEATWLWPPAVAQFREKDLQPGDVVTYDESMSFHGNLWTEDLRNRVEFVPFEGEAAYLGRLKELRAKWVGVRANSPAEAALRAQPQRFRALFAVPRTDERMYRVMQPW